MPQCCATSPALLARAGGACGEGGGWGGGYGLRICGRAPGCLVAVARPGPSPVRDSAPPGPASAQESRAGSPDDSDAVQRPPRCELGGGRFWRERKGESRREREGCLFFSAPGAPCPVDCAILTKQCSHKRGCRDAVAEQAAELAQQPPGSHSLRQTRLLPRSKSAPHAPAGGRSGPARAAPVPRPGHGPTMA